MGAVRAMVRSEVWPYADGKAFDTGSGLTQWDKITSKLGNVSISDTALAAPASNVSNMLLTTNAGGLAPMVDGKQVMTMTVYAAEYGPNYFKVKAGVPVRWEITSSGQPGCASGVVVSNILPGGSVYLNPNQGQVTVAEFTPQGLGTYKFSCSMNMVRGTIEVVN